MGQRLAKKGTPKKKSTTKKTASSSSFQATLDIKVSEKPKTAPVVSQTPAKIDFFGFSPNYFYQDFKRTLISTLVVVAILLIIFFVIK